MKGKRMLVLALLLMLSACAPAEEASGTVGADQAAQAVLEGSGDAAGLTALTGGELTDYLTAVCGLEEDWWTDAAVYAASGVDAREIIVLRLSEAGGEADVTQALEAHRQARLGDFTGYAPDQAALLEDAVVTAQAGYAALLVCGEPERALSALTETLGGESAAAVETPEPSRGVEAMAPFDPPNEFDMTPYDTGPILAAWESGDESGLSEKDAAILTQCRTLLAENVTEGMTDFEKELALHDALLRQGMYDETVYDPETPQGLPDNGNPYGLLVEGRGICMGYASSFQLLMDLAGVECITVVGASSRSTSDHAWNMVRLEGEWYCVDPTWNDARNRDGVSEETWNLLHHPYFNVTSDFMRESNHQWNYDAVPETDAVRFFWDGTGPLPE